MRSSMCLSLVLLALSFVLASCAALPDVAVDPLGPTPEDLTIDMTILTGRASDAGAEPPLRQSRLVLFADGSLHYGVDAKRGADWLPPRTRTLTRAQVAELWSLARQLGFTDPSRGDEMINFALVQARPGTVAHLVSFTSGGHRWAFIRTGALDQPPDEATSRLAGALAELAWAAGPTEPPAMVIPERRDFGPDPYERYR